MAETANQHFYHYHLSDRAMHGAATGCLPRALRTDLPKIYDCFVTPPAARKANSSVFPRTSPCSQRMPKLTCRYVHTRRTTHTFPGSCRSLGCLPRSNSMSRIHSAHRYCNRRQPLRTTPAACRRRMPEPLIAPGVTVARNSIITLGSVLLQSTEPNGIYRGNPATRIATRKLNPASSQIPNPRS